MRRVHHFYVAPSGVPVGIQATPEDSRTLTLDWNPPPEEFHNGIITQYTVNVSVTETGQRFHLIVDGETSVVLNGLHPYYVYNYIIAAATSVGLGPFTERNSVRMPQDGTHTLLLACMFSGACLCP